MLKLGQKQIVGLPEFTTRRRVNDEGAVDLTVVIPHRGPDMGLWATVHSCLADLTESGLSYNFIIVTNGDGKLPHSTHCALRYMESQGILRDHIHRPEPLAPPTARQMGTETANGQYLFFFDNHCLVKHGYFRRAVESMGKYNIDVLHSTTSYYIGQESHYEYALKLDKNFWGGSKMSPQDSSNPYRVAVGGHGGIVVRASTWRDVGGYWTGFVGYGGEECYFDLKMWLLGREVWIDPQLIHYHFAGERGYHRHFTDDYYRNMMMCANIIGGKEWLHKVHDSFLRQPRQKSDLTIYDLLQQAQIRSAEHALWMAQNRLKDLNTLLLWFAECGISH